MDKTTTISLPVQVVGRVDVGRLLREVEGLDNFMQQAAIRQPGTPLKMPKTSRLMDEMLAGSQLNMLHEQDRKQLLTFLTAVKARSPVLHMSFGADPSPLFLSKLMTWLRAEIHPQVLLQVGLQPNIGAGMIMRTTNKQFDFSLRHRFKKQRDTLVQRLHAMSDTPVPVVATAVASAPDTVLAPPAPAAAVPAIPTGGETSEQLAQIVESAIAQLEQPQVVPAVAPALVQAAPQAPAPATTTPAPAPPPTEHSA
ncbi:MAG TPA: hypothetical protein VK694_03290 [Verrucomicrobiae bacterium]|nr:hypothetical protein [Verrucomicrobiae bacterium]